MPDLAVHIRGLTFDRMDSNVITCLIRDFSPIYVSLVELKMDERIVPINTLEEVAKWAGGFLAVVTGFVAIVRGWYNSRFKGAHKRIDGLELTLSNQRKLVDKHDDKLSEHDSNLAVLKVLVKTGNDQRDKIEKSIDRLHDKFDKVIIGGG